jgi:protein-tyrosine-phosphatase
MNHQVIGIVCSGNTCRSPVAAAWLQHHLLMADKANSYRIWTAGLSDDASGADPVFLEPIEAAQQLGLHPECLSQLQWHKSRHISSIELPTNTLFWITDPEKVNDVEKDGRTRFNHMSSFAKRLGAKLSVIHEPDKAWIAKSEYLKLIEEKAPQLVLAQAYEKVNAEYWNQSLKLKSHTEQIANNLLVALD